ncbi:protein ALP1-like [Zingiber officinale]|uniref:protein ALP1-like n=1 Tax=Zingiber officinale TaxID=94328 RepID=UPI001C4BD4CC|nr:protein ALP1-like [Zingiber officinale]
MPFSRAPKTSPCTVFPVRHLLAHLLPVRHLLHTAVAHLLPVAIAASSIGGKFYLADAGYMLRSTFLTPYRSTRYHLKEYSRHSSENPKELFNLRHSSLRNAIERAFGVLKNRFPILEEMSRYDVETVSEIVLACCILHNLLVDFDPDEEIIAQVDRDLMNNEPGHGLANGAIARGEDGRRGEILRDSIAAQMWNDYITRH